MTLTDNSVDNYNITRALRRQEKVSTRLNNFFGRSVANIVLYVETSSNKFTIQWSVCDLPDECTDQGSTVSSSLIFSSSGLINSGFRSIFTPEYILDTIQENVNPECLNKITPPTAHNDPYTIEVSYCGGFDVTLPADLITDEEDGDMRQLTLTFQSPEGNSDINLTVNSGPAKWFSKRGGQIISFLKKCRPPWLADEENFWVYFALDGLILNCFVWNKRLK